jgi:hypothetical protein
MRQDILPLLTLAMFAAACSGPAAAPSAPSALSRSAADSDAAFGASADGDVKVGTGNLEIDAIRMDRQTSAGASVVRQYANPGRTYRMEFGETIELWIEWDRNIGKVPSGVLPRNPRLSVSWGDGTQDVIDCGSCLRKHTYKTKGLFTVVVTLDDMVSTTVTRTFYLDSRDPADVPMVTLTISCEDDEDCEGDSILTYFGAGGALTGSGFNCSSTEGGECGPLSFPVGTVITLTAQGSEIDSQYQGSNSMIRHWLGACADIGTGIEESTGTCTFTLTQHTTASVAFFAGF